MPKVVETQLKQETINENETEFFEEVVDIYNPSQEERDFILKTYKDFQNDYNLKNEGLNILGNRSLKEFWEQCNRDYNLTVDGIDENDPVTPYVSNISRDKSNAFVTNLTLQLIYPSVTAQNLNQEIDNVLSRVGRGMLEYAHNNDGRPSESGHQKTVRYIHKMVVEGTVHVQDDIIDGKLSSQLVPNNEIYIPNFWQPDIEKQPHVLRVQDDINYEQAREMFGDLPNFKYVLKGQYQQFITDNEEMKNHYEGMIEEDKVQIVYVQYNIPKKYFKYYNVPLKQKKAKLFNVIINGVLMFNHKNISPYNDGGYNITKGIFEHFSKAEFYWGNSAPNKMREDKKWMDGWKTLIRHKAKLAAIKPMITKNGNLIDEDFYIPGNITQAPANFKEDDLMVVPGIGDPVTQHDIAIMREAKTEIDEGNVSPQASGASQSGKQTASEAIIRERNEQKILGGFGLQVAFFLEARSFPILKRMFQFNTRDRITKIAVADQEVRDGITGSVEVIFADIPQMTKEEKMKKSFELRQQETKSIKAKNPVKKIYVDREYVNDLDLYLTAVADTKPKETSSFREARAEKKFSIYSTRPDLFNAKIAARAFAKEMGDTDEVLNQQQQIPQEQNNNKLNNQRPSEEEVVQKRLASSEKQVEGQI